MTPAPRPRRLRRSPAIRTLVRETRLSVHDLVQPLFVKPGGPPDPIPSLPGQSRLNPADLLNHCRQLSGLGLSAVALFPVIPDDLKDPQASAAFDDASFFHTALRALKEALPDLYLFADVALDPYTSHGHDGVLDARGDVDNDATVRLLARLAVTLARTGIDCAAPSDMMDGRIAALRAALDTAGFPHTALLAYAAKFNSAAYGPFRDAVGSALPGGAWLDKSTYQLDPANARQAARELALDEAEGADLLMVKPAGWYLDILRAARAATTLPLAAYQVSGEYAMIHAAAERGWIDLPRARDESLTTIKRAGADLIFSYFAADWARAHPHGISE